MKTTIAILLMLVAVASASKYYCPSDSNMFECNDSIHYPKSVGKLFCMTDGTWRCGECAVKEDTCFNNNKEASSVSGCAGTPKIPCS